MPTFSTAGSYASRTLMLFLPTALCAAPLAQAVPAGAAMAFVPNELGASRLHRKQVAR